MIVNGVFWFLDVVFFLFFTEVYGEDFIRKYCVKGENVGWREAGRDGDELDIVSSLEICVVRGDLIFKCFNLKK